jgi:hypothetical protein
MQNLFGDEIARELVKDKSLYFKICRLFEKVEVTSDKNNRYSNFTTPFI